MDSLKIFVRYPGGAGGHFIAVMILSLIKDFEIKEKHRGHSNIDDINCGHNFSNQWTTDFIKYTAYDINLQESTTWIQNNFEFYDYNQPLYVVHTHVKNPEPLLLAFTNTKLINIKTTEENNDQLAYNWITKSCFLYNQWKNVNQRLIGIQNTYNKLNHISKVGPSTDLKLLTYIQKIQTRPHYADQNNFMLNNDKTFNITFNDLVSGQLTEQLDDIIKFIGIDVTPERRNNAITLIKEYARTQTKVPWIQELNEYN